MQSINAQNSTYQQKTAFSSVEIKEFSDQKMDALIKNSDFKNYQILFKDILRQKKHILTQDQEDVLAQMSDAYIPFSTSYSKFIDGDLVYPEVSDPQGNKIAANYGNMYSTWDNPNREFRKEYTDKFYSTYKSYRNLLGSLVISNIKETNAYAKIRKYDSVLQNKYLSSDLPESIYDNLITVTGQHLDVMQRYLKIRQNYLGLDKTHYYDMFLPIEKDLTASFTYPQAQKMILTGLSKL